MRGISPIAQTLRSQARVGLTQRDSSTPERSREARAAASDVSVPGIAERQIAYLVWRLAPDNYQDTLREFTLLVEEFGPRARTTLRTELQRAANDQPLAQQALQQCASLVTRTMFTPLPEIGRAHV